MSNRIFLVCIAHQSPADSLLLCEREGQEHSPANFKHAEKWFNRHKNCTGSPDHFVLGHEKSPNWDVSPPAQDTPAGAVRMALVNGSSETH